ncbi:MAG: voltage-gated chloride channel family protein [Flavobacteriaceae bacterium]|nr:voltage-gated chloride channel family protein [Flavobacteriaceae bacterium]
MPKPNFLKLLKLLPSITFVSTLIGSASAFLLIALNWAENTRANNEYILFGLPIAGFFIGFIYHKYGGNSTKGNNLIIEEIQNRKTTIPLLMAPLVFMGTIITHLFGGSAGREGSAVQMGASISDNIQKLFKLDYNLRTLFLIIGISAGFSSIFGTPIAGALFGIEIVLIGKLKLKYLLPSLISAFVANYICELWPITHSVFSVEYVPSLGVENIVWVVLASFVFGLVAMSFSKTTDYMTSVFNKIKYPPLRPFVGGVVIVSLVYIVGTTKYLGLGVPIIESAFERNLFPQVFMLKLIFTSITLASGFKGGEVTPLFFIGATLGNVLSLFIPLPYSLLAAMGFVAVFSGATNTPLACSVMGIELFGFESGIYIVIACYFAYIVSGNTGIYKSQLIKINKPLTSKKDINSRLSDF